MLNQTIAIVDSGASNVRGVNNVVRQLGFASLIAASPDDLVGVSKIILPGVGNFDQGMKNLHKTGMAEALKEVFNTKKIPILGICLGMQLMTQGSEEGDCAGLGWFNGKTSKLKMDPDSNLKVPHLGWNTLRIKNDNKILTDISPSDEMYFVHGFGVVEAMEEQVLCTTNYGIEFVSGLCKNNLVGLQFHPEKSHENGQRILSNFIKTCIDHE